MPKNEIQEIHTLDPVSSLREVWPHEAHDFTPWLVEHIGMLNKALNMELEVLEIEKTLPGAGRVDIYSRHANTGEIVLIENQLGGRMIHTVSDCWGMLPRRKPISWYG